jgi:hypothetical protein
VTSPDDRTDPMLPDTAMASGSDEGEPGERGDSGPLGPDEQRLLERLERSAGDDAAGSPEETEAAARAAADDAPLPAEGGDQQDGLSAEFTEPDPGA